MQSTKIKLYIARSIKHGVNELALVNVETLAPPGFVFNENSSSSVVIRAGVFSYWIANYRCIESRFTVECI